MKRENGLTLIELLVTLAVIAVVIAIGLPSLNKFTEGNRSAAQVNQLTGTLSMARSSAIKRGMNVVVCTSNPTTTNPPKCSGSTAWESGWLVFADGDGDGYYTSTNDTLLAVNDGLKNTGLTMHSMNFTNLDKITFLANGSLKPNGSSLNQGTFVICPANKNLAHSRALNITPVGSISMAKRDTTSIPLDLSGNPVKCP